MNDIGMECDCGRELTEVWGIVATDDERDETYEGLIGYECKYCGYRIDLNGEIVD